MERTGRPLWQDTAPRSGAPPLALSGDLTCDVAVIGAGIVGLTVATELARSGRSVAVIEAREVGDGTTGGSSAKVSVLQGTRFADLAQKHDVGVVSRYAQANLIGQEHVRRTAEGRCPLDVADAVTYSTDADGRAALVAEAAAMPLPTTLEDAAADLPFATTGALRMAGQLQIDPLAYLRVLLDDALAAGVRVHTRTRVEKVSHGSPRELSCSGPAGRSRVRAGNVVVASGTPVLNRGGFFARLEPHRSYCVAVHAPEPVPGRLEGMYISADGPTRSIRRATGPAGEPLLVVGGNGHPPGRVHDTSTRVAELERFAVERLGAGATTHRWAAQDYATTDGLPFVGRLEPWSADLWVATGFAKWGLTAGTAAALTLVGHLTGVGVPWAADWDPWRGDAVAQAPGLASFAGHVAREASTGWAGTVRHDAPDPAEVAEGKGVVGRAGWRPVGVSRVDGQVRTVSAICPHMGGVLQWNDAEASWDCPLHGSRFAADGSRLEGPAKCGLARLENR